MPMIVFSLFDASAGAGDLADVAEVSDKSELGSVAEELSAEVGDNLDDEEVGDSVGGRLIPSKRGRPNTIVESSQQEVDALQQYRGRELMTSQGIRR